MSISFQGSLRETIDVKQAVKIAAEFLRDLFHNNQIYDLTLEEVEISDDDFWNITMSFQWKPGPEVRPSRSLLPDANAREFKIVRLNAKTGKVKSVKIRQ